MLRRSVTLDSYPAVYTVGVNWGFWYASLQLAGHLYTTLRPALPSLESTSSSVLRGP